MREREREERERNKRVIVRRERKEKIHPPTRQFQIEPSGIGEHKNISRLYVVVRNVQGRVQER